MSATVEAKGINIENLVSGCHHLCVQTHFLMGPVLCPIFLCTVTLQGGKI